MTNYKFKAWYKKYEKFMEILLFHYNKNGIFALILSDGKQDIPCFIDEIELIQFIGLYDDTIWNELTKEEQENWLKNNKKEEWKGKEIYNGDIIKHVCLETVFDNDIYEKLKEEKYSGKFDNIDEYENWIRKECEVEKEITRICLVKYNNGHYYMERENNQWLFFEVPKLHKIKKIGNIYENPELWKE